MFIVYRSSFIVYRLSFTVYRYRLTKVTVSHCPHAADFRFKPQAGSALAPGVGRRRLYKDRSLCGQTVRQYVGDDEPNGADHSSHQVAQERPHCMAPCCEQSRQHPPQAPWREALRECHTVQNLRANARLCQRLALHLALARQLVGQRMASKS